jgi:alpha-L-fucosidase 2
MRRACKMQGLHAESYQPLGNLRVTFTHPGDVSQYRRELDLDSACARARYTVGETQFTREAFASYPDRVIVFRATSSRPGQINCTVSLDGELQISSQPAGDDELLLIGKAASHIVYAGHPGSDHPIHKSDVPGEGMYFAAALHASVEGGGTISRSPEGLRISNASGVTLMLTSATGYRGFQTMPDKPMHEVVADAQQKLTSARRIPFHRLRERQQADHRSLFRKINGKPKVVGQRAH